MGDEDAVKNGYFKIDNKFSVRIFILIFVCLLFSYRKNDSALYTQLPSYSVNRSIYMQPLVEAEAGYQRRDSLNYVHRVKKSCQEFSFIQFLYNIIPVLKWLPNYSFKENIAGDISAGITVAVMHIPQGTRNYFFFFKKYLEFSFFFQKFCNGKY